MTPEDGNEYTLKKLCRDTCRSWLYDKIDGELDCPMCGISQQKRIEDGMYHGLHNSHVGLGFAKMLDNVLSTFLMSHDYTQNPYNESVGIVKSKFIELHTNALNSKKCAIQVSCSKCNPKIEKCTVAEIEMWKLRGKAAWKEAMYQCSPNRTNSRLDIRDYCVQSDSSSDDDTSMGPEYAMNNVGSRLNLQQTMRQQFNSSSDGDTPDNTSETPLSDSPGSKRQRAEDESPQNKKLRRSCVGCPDYSHSGQHLLPSAGTQALKETAVMQAWYDKRCIRNNARKVGCRRQEYPFHRERNVKAKKSFQSYIKEHHPDFPTLHAKTKVYDFLETKHKMYEKGSGQVWFEHLQINE